MNKTSSLPHAEDTELILKFLVRPFAAANAESLLLKFENYSALYSWAIAGLKANLDRCQLDKVDRFVGEGEIKLPLRRATLLLWRLRAEQLQVPVMQGADGRYLQHSETVRGLLHEAHPLDVFSKPQYEQPKPEPKPKPKTLPDAENSRLHEADTQLLYEHFVKQLKSKQPELWAKILQPSTSYPDLIRWIGPYMNCLDTELHRLTAGRMLCPKTRTSVMLWQERQREVGPEAASPLYVKHLQQVHEVLAAPHRNLGKACALADTSTIQPFVTEETTMKTTQDLNKQAFARVNYIYGVAVDQLSDDQLVAAIRRTELEIKSLQEITTESKKIRKQISKMQQNLGKIVAVLDSRD
jgi:hypothetical protein